MILISWDRHFWNMVTYAKELGYHSDRAFIEASWFMYQHVPHYEGNK